MATQPQGRRRQDFRLPFLFLVFATSLEALVLLPPVLAYKFYWIKSVTGFCIYGFMQLSLVGGVLLCLAKGIRELRARPLEALVVIIAAVAWLLAFVYVYTWTILLVV